MLSSAYIALKYSLIANRCVYLFQLPIYTQFLLGLLKTGSHFFHYWLSQPFWTYHIFGQIYSSEKKKYTHNTKNQKDAFPIDEIMTIFFFPISTLCRHKKKETKMKQSFEANAKQQQKNRSWPIIIFLSLMDVWYNF